MKSLLVIKRADSIKKISRLFLCVTLICTGLFSQGSVFAKGVEFFNGAYKEAKQLSQSENKILFVEIYNQYSISSKKMSSELFNDSEIGSIFNRYFVNYKIDAETDEGRSFKESHDIVGNAPELFFFHPHDEQYILVRESGLKSKNELIDIADKAVSLAGDLYLDQATMDRLESGKSLPSIDILNQDFENGKLKGAALKDYVYKLRLHNLPCEKVVNACLPQKKWFDLIPVTNYDHGFVFNYADEAGSRAIELLIRDKKTFEGKYGTEVVQNKLMSSLYNYTLEAAKTHNQAAFKRALRLSRKAQVADPENYLYHLKANYYKNTKNWQAYINATRIYMRKQVINNPVFLNNRSWDILLHTPKRRNLKTALKWTIQSIILEDRYYNNETLAHVYLKMGDRDMAIISAKRAIHLGMNEGVEIFGALRLLEKVGEAAPIRIDL